MENGDEKKDQIAENDVDDEEDKTFVTQLLQKQVEYEATRSAGAASIKKIASTLQSIKTFRAEDVDIINPMDTRALSELQATLITIEKEQDGRRSELSSFLKSMEKYGYSARGEPSDHTTADKSDSLNTSKTEEPVVVNCGKEELAESRAAVSRLDTLLEQKDAEVKKTGDFKSLMNDVAEAISAWNLSLSDEKLQSFELDDEDQSLLPSPKSVASTRSISSTASSTSRASSRSNKSTKSKTKKSVKSKIDAGLRTNVKKEDTNTARSMKNAEAGESASNSARSRSQKKGKKGSARVQSNNAEAGEAGVSFSGTEAPSGRRLRASAEEIAKILTTSEVVTSSLLPSQESHVTRIMEQDHRGVSSDICAYRADAPDMAKLNEIERDLHKLSKSPPNKGSRIRSLDALSRLPDAPVSVMATNQSIEECRSTYMRYHDNMEELLRHPVQSIVSIHCAIRSALVSPTPVPLPSVVHNNSARSEEERSHALAAAMSAVSPGRSHGRTSVVTFANPES